MHPSSPLPLVTKATCSRVRVPSLQATDWYLLSDLRYYWKCTINVMCFSSDQSLSHVRLFVKSWTAARQASLPITNSRSLLKLMSIESVMPYNHLILSSTSPPDFNLSQHQGLFKWVFASGGQSTGVSTLASVLPMNIKDCFSLGWTGWISLQSKGLSRVFSNTTVQKYLFFSAQLSLLPNSHIHTWLVEKP